MLFNSYAFLLVFLPAAVGIYCLSDPYPRARMPVLILLSLVFYGYWDARFLPLMIGSILLNWLAIRVHIAWRSNAAIVAAIVANLGILAGFKYLNFFTQSFSYVTHGSMSYIDLALPLGISFFTFHHIMYLVDLKRGIAPKVELERYALYICFFPQVLSGPLVRWSEVFHQFGERMLRPGWQQRCALGATFMVVGLVQKVFLGDHLAAIANPIFAQAAAGAPTRMQAIAGVGAFTFQILFDFSGYSDIAIGLALLLGITLPINFNAPYQALSIRDFWRRWHMTLSRFLRDYLYVPLGGNRQGLLRQIAAVLTTMALGGLWHGAGWTFVAWGVLHGLAISLAVVWSRFLPSPPQLVSWAATFGFVAFTWIFFRAGSFDVALRILGAIFSGAPGELQEGWRTIAIAAACAFLLPPSAELCKWLTRRPSTLVAIGLGLAMAAILVELGREQPHEFIYFRF